MPKISIVIPVYNTEKYLKKCLDSVMNQTLQDIEIIIINDGSTDNSYKICKEYKRKDSRIVLINQKNKGLGEVRNKGIKLAKSPYIAFVDSDDFISCCMLEKLYTKLLEDDSDIAKCSYARVSQDGSITNEHSKAISLTKDEFFKSLLSVDYLSIFPNGIYKKELFMKNDLFFKKITYEDAELLFKIFYYSKKFSFVNESLYFWRKTDNSISRSICKKQIDDIFNVCTLTYNFLQKQKIYREYELDFMQRYSYYQNLIINKILDYEKDNKKEYLRYFEHKMLKSSFLSSSNNLANKSCYVSYLMKQASLYLSCSKKLFDTYSKKYLNDISNLNSGKDTYVVYGNGTVSKVLQNLISDKITGIVDIADENQQPEKIKKIVFDKVIISVLGREYSITKYLVEDLMISEKKILTLQEIIKLPSADQDLFTDLQ